MVNYSRGISDTELDVLKIIWNHGPGTVRVVHEALEKEGRTYAYNTVLTLLRRLQDKGCVKPRKKGRAHEYHVVVTRDDLLRERLDELAERVCEGATSPLMLTLFEGGRFTAKEIEEFKALLDRKDPERKRSTKGGKRTSRARRGPGS